MELTLIARLIVGTVLGAVIGLERQVHGRAAGLRTHFIVALASTTFMIVSTHFVYFQHYTRDDLVSVDTSRIAASVVTGMGFLGAGAILRTGLGIQGLTTAAGLWLVAAIGLSAGAGMFAVSITATLLGVLALTVVRRLEGKDDHVVRRRISFVVDPSGPAIGTLLSALRQHAATVSASEYDRRVDEGTTTVTLHATVRADGVDRLVEVLAEHPGVRRVRIEPVT